MSEEQEHHDEGIKNLEDNEITTNWDELTTSFDSMELKEELLRGIYAYGFERPSAIQQVSEKAILKHNNYSHEYFLVESHQANINWQRCYCTSPIR